MLLQKEREEIVAYGKKMISSGLTKEQAVILVFSIGSKVLLAISPSGLDYYETKPEDVVILNLDGDVVEERENHQANLICILFIIESVKI